MELWPRFIRATPSLAGLTLRPRKAARDLDGPGITEPFYAWERLTQVGRETINGDHWAALDTNGRRLRRGRWRQAVVFTVRNGREARVARRCFERAMRREAKRDDLHVVEEWTTVRARESLAVCAGLLIVAAVLTFGCLRIFLKLVSEPVWLVEPDISWLLYAGPLLLAVLVSVGGVLGATRLWAWQRPPLVRRSCLTRFGVLLHFTDDSIAFVEWEQWHDVAVGRASYRILHRDGRELRWFGRIPQRTRTLMGIILRERFPEWPDDMRTVRRRAAWRFALTIWILGLAGAAMIHWLPARNDMPALMAPGFAAVMLAAGAVFGWQAWRHGLGDVALIRVD